MSKEEDRPRCEFMVAGARWTTHRCRSPGREICPTTGKLLCRTHTAAGVERARQVREVRRAHQAHKAHEITSTKFTKKESPDAR